MKLSLRLYIFAFLICQFSFAGIGPPVGQCANCLIKPNLPALEVAVSDNEGDNTAVSLLTDTVRGAGNTVIPAGYDIQNGDYLAWCVDTPTFPVFGSFRLTAPLSTLDPVLLALNPGFNKVNYILNHKNGADYHDIQRAIWTVLGLSGGISASFPPDAGSTAALIAAADAHPGYQPGPGEVMGLVMPADGFGGRLQDTMLELPVPKCGTIGDFVWVDTNHDGLQNDGNTGINGVTVTLTDSSGNLLAFTVTANAPNGYTALTGLPPNAPGYYQFTGLCAGTYKVVVNDSQPGLTGYTRTLDTVGFPANSAIDSNRNIDNVVLLTDHTIDETIDFGYTVPSLLASCASAITGTPGVPYSSFILASGGSTPYTFTLNSGLLPGGLNLNSSTGEISGTPNATGVFNFTVKVTDSTGLAHLTATTSSCGITVSVIPPTATCVSIAAVQGVAITPVTMLGSGGAGAPFTFSATGLPAGLSMASDGTISGTPGANGTFPYVVTVKDKDGNAGTTNCSVTVLAAPSATCVTIVAVQGVAIAPVTMLGTGGTGGPYTFSATGLPAGVTMASDGTISGTPGSSGTFPYVVTVKDKDGNIGTVNCSMTVNASPSANCVAIVAVQGVAITPVTMIGSGGTGAPYTFSATGLPAGLTMASDGTISGTPGASGTFPYVVTVKDSAGNIGTINCSVTVLAPPSANCVAIVAVQGVAITPVTMIGSSGTGAPYTFSATGLPAGLTMASDGTISGTPGASGTFPYVVTVKDSAGNIGTINCSVTVKVPPSATCVTIVAVQGVAITPVQMIGSGGTGAPYTFSSTGLPAGLSMASDGTISGTPGASGTFPYVVTVKDSAGNIGTINCSVTVKVPPSATCVTIVAVQGTAITPVTMIGSGGTGAPYTFSATGLPAGLTMSSTGTISGTPTGTGTFPYVVTVKDSAGNTGTVNCSVTVKVAPSATCVAITAYQNTAITAVTMIGSGGTGAPYTFSATGLPAGLTMSSTGTISGTPTGTGTFPYVVTVKDSAGNTGTVNCSVTVQPPVTPPTPVNLTCGTCASNQAKLGVAYSSQLAVSGGTGPFKYTMAAGSLLPAGLTLNLNTGVISGTPTAAGTFIFTTVVTDAAGKTDTATCTIIVVGPPIDLACGTCGASAAYVGTPYTATLKVTGGTAPFTFSVVYGSLPAGLTLNTATGVISGTPTAAGSSSFKIKVVDANGSVDTSICSLVVKTSPVNLDCGLCGSGKAYVGKTFAETLVATGGTKPYTYSVVSGTLPAGLTLNTSTGIVSGTPTVAGSFTITFKVVDANGYSDTATCTLGVAYTSVNLECGICGTAQGKIGTAYSAALAVTGGKAPYTFSVYSGTLPSGLTLNSSTGVVSGTPSVAGSYTVTFKVADANGSSDTTQCTIVIAGSSLNLDCGLCGGAKLTVGVAFSSTLSRTGGTSPFVFSIYSGSLPAGLTLNSSTGVVSGTPTTAGTYTFVAKVVDSRGVSDTTSSCTITVQTSPIDLQCGACGQSNGTTGSPYSASLAVVGGYGPFTYSVYSGTLPGGLTLNSSTGLISGTPTTAGTYAITFKVVNSRGAGDTVICTIVIGASAIDLQCGSCGAAKGIAGTAYSSTLKVVGGTPSFTFSKVSGTLPAGLTLNTATGVISGTPTTAGSYSVTFKVADSKGKYDTVVCTIVIVSPVDLQCGVCGGTNANLGVAFSTTLSVKGGSGPYTFSLVSGSLPAGVTLNATTGVISGTPNASGTYSFTTKVVDANGLSDTATCTLLVKGTIVCGAFTTYTQGGWGATPSGNNPGTLLVNNWTKVYGTSGVTIGGSYYLKFTSASAIANFLPQDGTAGTLYGSATNATSSAAGVLAGQVLSLQLSVDFSNKGITRSGLSSLKVASGELAGKTVAQVLTLANQVLGGQTSALPYGLTITELNAIIDAINNNFDGGISNDHFLM